MAAEDELAGMDAEGLRRTLGELLASNRATQANLDEIRQQFPIQPANVANGIPTWEELEEGGLEPPVPEEGEGESFAEQLGAGFNDILWVEVSAAGGILNGGEGLTVEHPETGVYKIFLQSATQETFDYPGAIRSCLSATAAGSTHQATNTNINLIESAGGVKGYEIRIVENLALSALVDSNFHFFTANLDVEV